MYVPNIDGDKREEDEDGKSLHVGQDDDEDTFEKVQAVVQTVLDAVDDTPLVLGDSLLEDLVDCQINNPQPEPGQDNSEKEH